MFTLIYSPFDTPVVWYSAIIYLSHRPFHYLDILMELFSLLITHISAIIWKSILMGIQKMNLNTHINAYAQ